MKRQEYKNQEYIESRNKITRDKKQAIKIEEYKKQESRIKIEEYKRQESRAQAIRIEEYKR